MAANSGPNGRERGFDFGLLPLGEWSPRDDPIFTPDSARALDDQDFVLEYDPCRPIGQTVVGHDRRQPPHRVERTLEFRIPDPKELRLIGTVQMAHAGDGLIVRSRSDPQKNIHAIVGIVAAIERDVAAARIERYPTGPKVVERRRPIVVFIPLVPELLCRRARRCQLLQPSRPQSCSGAHCEAKPAIVHHVENRQSRQTQDDADGEPPADAEKGSSLHDVGARRDIMRFGSEAPAHTWDYDSTDRILKSLERRRFVFSKIDGAVRASSNPSWMRPEPSVAPIKNRRVPPRVDPSPP